MAKSLVDAYQQTHRYVLRSLEEARGSWRDICEETGMSYFTLQKIAQGTIERPSVEHLQTLSDYFRQAA